MEISFEISLSIFSSLPRNIPCLGTFPSENFTNLIFVCLYVKWTYLSMGLECTTNAAFEFDLNVYIAEMKLKTAELKAKEGWNG